MTDKDTLQRVSLIKQLSLWGFREKHIRMITQDNQPFINKVLNGKLHRNTDIVEIVFEKDVRERLEALQRFLEKRDIFTDDEDQEARYMQILRVMLVPKQEIYELYNFMAKAKVGRMLNKKLDLSEFDSRLIGVKTDVFIDLVIDFI